MAEVGNSFWVLTILLILPLASPAFIPNTATVATGTHLPCPKSCRCLDEEKIASCVLPYSEFSLESLAPWNLRTLELYQKGWQHGDVVYPSLKSALYEESKMAVTDQENAVLRLPYLVHLDISNIAIQKLRDFTFMNMPNLQILKLTYDGITELEPYTFAGLSQLRHLSLRNNSLSSLPYNIFDDLVQLISLDLSENHFSAIDGNTFNRLSNLEELNLNRNALNHVGGFMKNLTSLQTLDLSYNSISYVQNDTMNSLLAVDAVALIGNKFECSCAIHALIFSAQQNQSILNPDEVTCSGPSELIGQSFKDIVLEDLPCEEARIETLTDDLAINHHGDMTLNCTAIGSPPLGIYWITPWGDKYTHSNIHNLLPEHISEVKYDIPISGVNLPMESRVFVSENGSLHIKNFRGYFAGNFSCVAVNLIGSDEASVEVKIYSTLPSVYHRSLFFSAACAVVAFIVGSLIGGIRWCVSKCFHEDECNCCCCSNDDEFVDPKSMYRVDSEEIEVKNGVLIYKAKCGSDDDKDDYYEDSPPKTPFNSPATQESPSKCHTPDEEQVETEGWISSRILEQLDEVRSRLRYGAERKMMKVKSLGKRYKESSTIKIKNMRETGSRQIQSIRETGSLAATAVMKSVESGMEQVKYGYQSIKEFCGTSDMGPGTISMVSVTTDVDTKEQVRVVKSHTFV